MRTILLCTLACVAFCVSLNAQSKSNVDIERQLKSLGAAKNIELTYDKSSNTSKLMAVSENFADGEASRAGVRAMNFATGFFFPGSSLELAPDPILLTFWVLAKKPVFGQDHSMTLYIEGESIEIGDSRYVARARDNMEYLNYSLSRDVFKKIASNSDVRFRLGNADFKFSPGQIKMIANLVLLSDPANSK